MDRLLALQRNIEARADLGCDASFVDRLCVTQAGNQACLDFYGDPFGEAFSELLDVLSETSVASTICALDIRGPDEGSNGTRN